MRGIPQFNFPAFREGAAQLRAEGHEVFSPAEHDESTFGEGFADANTEGSEDVAAAQAGISTDKLRRMLFGADLDWICKNADAIALLPGWENSKGVRAELATANALGLQVTYLIARDSGGFDWLSE
jgi:hypothetical protein